MAKLAERWLGAGLTAERALVSKFLWPYRQMPSQALWRAIEAKLLRSLGLKFPLLDLGCGDGVFASAVLAGRPGEVVGLDLEEAALQKAARTGTYRIVCLADARGLPFQDEQFATVLSNCVLEHIPSVEQVLSEIARVLRPGGLLVFTVPTEKFTEYLCVPDVSSPKERREIAEWLNRRLDHRNLWSVERWEKELERCGLRLLSVRPYLPKQVEQVWSKMTIRFLRRIPGLGEVGGLLVSRKSRMLHIDGLVYSYYLSVLPYWVKLGAAKCKNGGAMLLLAQRV